MEFFVTPLLSPPFTFALALVIFGFLVGTYTDLRWREMPDWASYGMIFAGIGLNAFASLLYRSWVWIVSSLAGLLLFYLLAAFLYYTGQWGGGDSKALMGMGALLGVDPWMLLSGRLPLSIAFFGNALVIGAFYGLVWSLVLAAVHWRGFGPAFARHWKRRRKARLYGFSAAALLLIAALATGDFLMKLMLLLLAGFIVLFLALMAFVKGVEESCMYRDATPDQLVEGDWIADEIVVATQLPPKEAFRQKYAAALAREESGDVLLKLLRLLAEMFPCRATRGLVERRKAHFSFSALYDGLTRHLATAVLMESVRSVQRIYARVYYGVWKKRLVTDLARLVDEALSSDRRHLKALMRRYPSLKGLEAALAEEHLFYGKLSVAGPADLGIEREAIGILSKLHAKGELSTVRVKDGVPFVPSFLLALLFTLAWGSVFTLVF